VVQILVKGDLWGFAKVMAHDRLATSVVQRQLEAYNARDLQSFLANFSESIQTYLPPGTEPVIVGKKQLADFYAQERFNKANLYAELISRTVLGNKVFDRERIWGITEQPIEMVVVFEVTDALISRMWGFTAT
jgi:hypothetical protein